MWRTTRSALTNTRVPTVEGLVELANVCPKLRRISISALDASVLPEESALLVLREGHQGLRILDAHVLVRHKGVKPEEVASLLGRFFPQLNKYYLTKLSSPEPWL